MTRTAGKQGASRSTGEDVYSGMADAAIPVCHRRRAMIVCNRGRRIRVLVLLAAVGPLLGSGRSGAADRPKAVLKGHNFQVLSAAFSPDARTLASVGEDRTLRVWDLATGKARTTLKGN